MEDLINNIEGCTRDDFSKTTKYEIEGLIERYVQKRIEESIIKIRQNLIKEINKVEDSYYYKNGLLKAEEIIKNYEKS
jgi:hypothetical protein